MFSMTSHKQTSLASVLMIVVANFSLETKEAAPTASMSRMESRKSASKNQVIIRLQERLSEGDLRMIRTKIFLV